MSILIDELIKDNEMVEINGTWYIARPLNKPGLIQRIKDALWVLYGNARAYHYFEDEADTWGEVNE